MKLRKGLPLFASFIFLASLIVPSVFAETIAVIGTGQVAQALGPKYWP